MASLVYLFLTLVAAASAAPESRIVGGTPVDITEFPYIVSMPYLYPGPGITVQRCVGSLISSWHVLTSGFCFTGAVLSNMQVRAGSTNSLSGGILVNIRDMVKHPDYVETPRAGDIAVVFLEFPLGISNTINVLFLPPANFYIADGQPVKIVSWGFEYENGPQLELLKSVTLNKLSLEECQSRFADSESITITDKVICAGQIGMGMCAGDAGAPMAINNVLVGFSSFYKTCLEDGHPDVFTRVDRYTDWILETATPGRSGASDIRTVPITL